MNQMLKAVMLVVGALAMSVSMAPAKAVGLTVFEIVAATALFTVAAIPQVEIAQDGQRRQRCHELHSVARDPLTDPETYFHYYDAFVADFGDEDGRGVSYARMGGKDGKTITCSSWGTAPKG